MLGFLSGTSILWHQLYVYPMQIPGVFGYCSFRVSFEIGTVSPPSLFVFFKIASDILGPLHLHTCFSINIS